MIAFHHFGAPDLRTSQWWMGVILYFHGVWLRGEPGGVRANLTRANLTRANIVDANLAGANLTDANLTRANLSESIGIRYGSVTWHGHGQRGRMLTGLVINGGIRLFCGCFRGTEAELREYIAEGAEKYRASRTKALEFVLSCLNEVES